MRTMVMKQVISFHVNNGIQVACTFLDATKAFDRFEYCNLFSLLLARQLPPGLPVNSSRDQLVTRSTPHTANSSDSQLVTIRHTWQDANI